MTAPLVTAGVGPLVLQVSGGRAAAALVVATAVLAAALVRPQGTRVLLDRLAARRPGGGPRSQGDEVRGTVGSDRAGPERAGARLGGSGRSDSSRGDGRGSGGSRGDGRGSGGSRGDTDRGAAAFVAADGAGRAVRAAALAGAAGAVALAAGADVGSLVRAVISTLSRSGLLGASPALAVVAVVAARARLRSRRRRTAVAARAALIRATEALLADLRAGAGSLDALAAAAVELPELGPVAAAARLGGDVPAALAALAGRPGLSGLGHLAAAWAVSAETGSSLTGTLDRLVDALRDAEEVRQETDVSLATPRATARLLAALPAAGLGLGTLVGADPWGFLTGSAAGAAIATAGALLAGTGLEWVEALADRVQLVGGDPSGAPPGGPDVAAGTAG